ncbi:TonB-dependent receptor domain-containing protein [Caulobacter vibrioides]|uniref:TonB-dependent receptor n=2 Tax=Caulobacter vibrioides TaxID=155892 RepID=Q9A442_CAUVC|nr:TonB-dependent receptor [Caulobacter vibrioides]YP_002518469.1 TonB-dependent receptor [Caulobacter vibrioides NA1000]AAK24963.1 TonB-dependent receptor [Caulobacter vibrioides CB15]ACL96561.1 TonB-dependent receptor [Caulobacter vibrioides NA1000]ATC29835.1 TonB-dependent receptor [Caulobacter vibrioides]QXZ51351.1 TonB-dependent receptor [Caulobacter vibrioides]
MKMLYVSAAIVPLLFVAPSHVLAQTAATKTAEAPGIPAANAPASREEVFSTGVAKGRDRLDSATSTSALRERDIEVSGGRSLGDLLRNLPGIRTESSTGDGSSAYTIRGLPLASGGSKYMQLQEDGLPVLEFGDFFNGAVDIYIRADLNLAAVESIRGGSSSTFASNSPAGVINLISKTGDVKGGTVLLTTGLDYDTNRVDFSYGAPINDKWRFHVGGFYRVGEGPRKVGFDAFKGGQLKFNVTRQFENGYVRLSGKYLDDRSPHYLPGPIRITGTNDDPVFSSFNTYDVRHDSMNAGNLGKLITLDADNKPVQMPLSQGMNALVKSIGLESQFEVQGWTITQRGRYSDIEGGTLRNLVANIFSGAAMPASLGGGTGTFSYATGPSAGQVITNLGALNGNGLVVGSSLNRIESRSLNNFINDLRATRAFDVGKGELTVTGGVYKSIQDYTSDWLYSNHLQDVAADGNSSLINYTNAAGVPQTQNGYLGFNRSGPTAFFRRSYDVRYNITAPYGSLNYRIGKMAIGGSLRYDGGRVRGDLYGADLGGGRIGIRSVDFNGDGVISVAESKTAFTPFDSPAPVHYNYGYVSYSVGVNYRVAEPFAVFARYSRGARAGADKLLFSTKVSTTDGRLINKSDGYDIVKQFEAGFKYRAPNFTVNVTAFSADTEDTNVQAGAITTDRTYKAYGVEAEGTYRHGPFSVRGGVTYTDAELVNDKLNAAVAGKVPRRQPDFIYQATPQLDLGQVTIGANIIGTTESWVQDNNLMKMPGYTLVGAFAQYRVTDKLQLMLNAENLFDKVAIIEITTPSVPANGIGLGRAANGRTVSMSARMHF